MSNIQVYTVLSNGQSEGDNYVGGTIRLATLYLEEAERCARSIYKAEGEKEIPAIIASAHVPMDWTTKEARKASPRRKDVLTRLAEDAAKIRAAKFSSGISSESPATV